MNIPNLQAQQLAQEQMRMAADILEKSESLKCECGGILFKENTVFRKLSRILTGEAKDTVVPVPVYCCITCNKPLPELVPSFLKAEFNKIVKIDFK